MELVKFIGPLILAFIMFSLGIGLSLENFKSVIVKPKDFIIGAISQVSYLAHNSTNFNLLISNSYRVKGRINVISSSTWWCNYQCYN